MKRISAFFIALFMIMAQFPMVATAETNNIEDGSVAYFKPLTSEVEKQTVNTETQLSGLSLPDTLSASIYHVTNTLDKGEVITTSDVDIPVTWNSEPAYDETKAGTYVFSASIEGYVLSENAQLPVISVVNTSSLNQSINEPLTKTIADWSFVATDYSDYSENELVMVGVSMENQASFDAVVSMLPTQLSVHIENESNTSTVDITGWKCVEYKQDVQNNWPVKGEVITTSDVDIPVTWNSEPAYDENKAGTYVFSASIEGYVLSENAQLPVILVVTTDSLNQSINEPLTKTITDWTFVATDYSNYKENELVMAGVSMENQASFDAVVSMLPTQLSVHIENEANTSTVDITDWECVEYKQDMYDNWPVSGEYIFTAKLQEGFECEPFPSIRVIIGGITTYANNTIDELGLTVAASNDGEVEYNEGSGFTLKTSGTYEISGKWAGKLENLDQNKQKAVITVPKNVTANVTLNGVDIDVSTITYASAFNVSANGTANITLTGTNTLTSGGERAGLEVSENAEVKISSDGSLIATGGSNGAGIGGGNESGGGTIVISGGNITVTSSDGGAGIGGGIAGNGGIIKISGGTITAKGSNNGGAGIGGGRAGNGGTIEISGGKVEATGGGGGAGIGGGGNGGTSGNITIIGSVVVKASGSGYGVMVDSELDNGIIQIGGGAIVTATGGEQSAGIGGGSNKGEGSAGIGGGAGVHHGGHIEIFGVGTKVTTTGEGSAYDIGGSTKESTGSLSVTDGATLEMKANGTNINNSVYSDCTIILENVTTRYTAIPLINSQPQNQTTPVGNPVTLTVNASVSDGGVLSYQWYSKTANDTTKGVMVGDNNKSYNPPVNVLGTTYYYVIITNTKSGENDFKPTTATSNVVSVTVTAPSTSSSSNGISVKNTYSTKKDTINQTISSSNLKSLIRNKKTLTLNSNKVSMSFEPDALKSILDVIPSSARKITFKAVPADLSAYPNASAMIGNHPVYDFSISYKDSKGKEHLVYIDFPTGSVGISLNYTPTANETAGNLFMVAIDDKGNITWLDYSSYGKGQVIAEALHFSLYGIAYKTETPTFNDITNHWAKSDIEFVVARGLLAGENNLFTPDSLLTRGMFIKALEQLAGIDSKPTHNLDEALTREQAALILADYAEQLEITMPETLSAIKYADQSKISTTARKAVKLMQRAGIIRGKDGNQFDSQGKVTKAEGAAILHRFIEAVIDPSVMNGWLKNDSGHWQYHQKGKAVTGWQTIDKLRYYFNDDGEMYEGWKYDKKKWYYWNNDGAVIGWKFINGKWYYFENDGVMASNTWIEGYQLGEDGAWIK